MAIQFVGCLEILRKSLKDKGFPCKKREKAILEKHDICHKVLDVEERWQNIVFMDKSYVHTSHTNEECWTGKNKKGVKKPISKERLIIVHTGKEMVFL